MKKFIFTTIILLALVLRVVGIASFPVGFTQDEAAIGYDAYSLLLTGRDQWGESWPLILRSFGDFKMPLYSYLAIPSIAIFGLNEFATRLPNAIIGTLAVLATYLMSKQLFKDKQSLLLRNNKFGFWNFACYLVSLFAGNISLAYKSIKGCI